MTAKERVMQHSRTRMLFLAVLFVLTSLLLLAGGCTEPLRRLTPPAWIHGTWLIAVNTGRDEILILEVGFKFTADSAYLIAPEMRLDLGEFYQRAGSGDEVATDTLYSFTVEQPQGAFHFDEGVFVTYEFRNVRMGRSVDWTMKTALVEIGPHRLVSFWDY